MAIDQEFAAPSRAGAAGRPIGTWARRYILAVLTAVYALNVVDRTILVILQEPIKHEFNLSDTQLGLLTGFAFSAFYSISSLFIAGLADTGVRRSILAGAVAVWSLSTAACGFVGNYALLFLARAGVGVAESGSVPTSQSMIADLYSPAKRGGALGILSCGIFLGHFVGLAVGGWVGAQLGWRSTFMLLGGFGVVFALVIRMTVAEPARSESAAEDRPSLWAVLTLLARSPVFVNMAIGSALYSAMVGVNNFMPSFMMRSHALTLGQVGLWLGLIGGVAGAVGATISGRATDRLGRRDLVRLPWIPAAMMALATPFLILGLTTGNPVIMMLAYFFPSMTVAAHIPPAITVANSLVPHQARARAAAVVFLMLNLVGASLGPLFIGLLSDLLKPRYGAGALGIAMITVFLGAAVWSTCHLMRASHHLRRAAALQTG